VKIKKIKIICNIAILMILIYTLSHPSCSRYLIKMFTFDNKVLTFTSQVEKRWGTKTRVRVLKETGGKISQQHET